MKKLSKLFVNGVLLALIANVLQGNATLSTAHASVFLHYGFDGNFLDDSGNNNHGLLSDEGDTSFVALSTVFGQAWDDPEEFDPNDRVDFMTAFNPGPGQAWTIAFWHDMAGGVSMPLFSNSDNNNQFQVRADSANRATLKIAGQPDRVWDTNLTLSQDGFFHYAIVANPDGIAGVDVDGVPGNDKIALYVDGVLITPDPSQDLTNYATNVFANNIGDGSAVDSGPSLQFSTGHGITDELWIFDSEALTVTQINNLMSFNAVAEPIASPTIISTTEVPDVTVFTANGGTVSNVPLEGTDLASILTGDSSAPGGNVELFSGAEALDNDMYDLNQEAPCIAGQTGGEAIQLCGLTAADWESDVDGNGQTLLGNIADTAIEKYNLGWVPGLKELAMGQFVENGGRQRFSDPNVSYINKSPSGEIRIGLAGYLNATPALEKVVPEPFMPLVPEVAVGSEVVKVIHDGKVDYLIGFEATPSGQSAEGGKSYAGNYEVVLFRDADEDGVPDDADICSGFDDNVDNDSDGIPDGCDACPLDADSDADGDGVCGDVDTCPTVGFASSGTLIEGQELSLSASSSESAATFEWDLGDGNTGSGSPLMHTFSDNGTFDVAITAADNLGGICTQIFQLTIANVLPTATFTATPQVLRGESATLAFSDSTDPSPVDTAAGFGYSFDCTDDGTFEVTDGATPSFACPYTQPGTVTVRGVISDKDQNGTPYTAQITVLSLTQAGEMLRGLVEDLRSQKVINKKEMNALLTKNMISLLGDLDRLTAADRGKEPAISYLRRFISQVEEFVTDEVLSPAQGQQLIVLANRLTAAIAVT